VTPSQSERSVESPTVVKNPTEQRHRRAVALSALIVGAALIGATLRVERGSATFYIAGYALAAVWVVAALLSLPIRWTGAMFHPRIELAIGTVVGTAMFGVFVAADEIGRHISFIAGPTVNLLAKADAGPVVAVLALALVNGVAEEMFFRGSLPDAVGGRTPLVISTVVYIAVAATAGNTALTLAAIVMGVVFALVRSRTGGLIAPITTHLVWSTLVVLALPR